MKELGVQGVFKHCLKPRATPDVPLQSADETKDGGMVLSLPRRTAFEKRRKAEILEMAYEEHARAPTPEISDLDTTNIEEADDVEVCIAAAESEIHVQTPTIKPEVRMVNKKLQVCLRPPQRTRSHQTDSKMTSSIQTFPTVRTTGTQTDLFIGSDRDDVSIPSGDDDSSDEEYDPVEDDLSSDEENSEDDEAETLVDMNYKLNSTTSPVNENQFLVSESALTELLGVCRYCSSDTTSVIRHTRGTLIVTDSVCVNGHISIWKSQSCHKSLPWSNLLTATAIMCSGINASKAMRMFQHMNVQMFSNRTCTRLQSMYVSPAATDTWDAEQATLLEEMHGKDVVVGGDARCDSPGYSAKYGSYTIMDLQTSKILDFQLVQSNEVKGSTHMELEGLKRSIVFLEGHVTMKDLVTDRHTMVKKYMREQHPDKNHYFDVWHVAKGLTKKLEGAAKRTKSAADIRPWIKSITNHVYWISASCGTDQDLKSAKWLAISNHVANKHDNHSDQYPSCEHGELAQQRQWLKEGSVPHKLLKEVLENKHLMKDVPKLSPVHQTYGLEVFHSVVNHFAPKSTHFFYGGMLARLGIAALHYNENCRRSQSTTTDGQQRFTLNYPKAKKGTAAVVKPVRSPPSFDYITLIKQAVVERRKDNPSYMCATEDLKVYNNHHPIHLTAMYTQFNKRQLIEEHRSRFQNRS